MNNDRHFGLSRSERHCALDNEYPPEWLKAARAAAARCSGSCNQGRACDCVPDIEENTVPLPAHRSALSGRTYSSPWDAGWVGPGAAITRPPKSRRIADIAFGLAMAGVVAFFVWVMLTYGGVRP